MRDNGVGDGSCSESDLAIVHMGRKSHRRACGLEPGTYRKVDARRSVLGLARSAPCPKPWRGRRR
eukprot:5747532-Prorocentrum_lima.AAC.1